MEIHKRTPFLLERNIYWHIMVNVFLFFSRLLSQWWWMVNKYMNDNILNTLTIVIILMKLFICEINYFFFFLKIQATYSMIINTNALLVSQFDKNNSTIVRCMFNKRRSIVLNVNKCHRNFCLIQNNKEWTVFGEPLSQNARYFRWTLFVCILMINKTVSKTTVSIRFNQ